MDQRYVRVPMKTPSRAVVASLSALIALLLVVVTAPARADIPTCPELPCSVNRNCSSTGVACLPEDRDCVNRAREKELEVKCEQRCSLPGNGGFTQLVYCPADTGRSDSKIVWVLLSLAFVLAIAGSVVAWRVLRKKAA